MSHYRYHVNCHRSQGACDDVRRRLFWTQCGCGVLCIVVVVLGVALLLGGV